MLPGGMQSRREKNLVFGTLLILLAASGFGFQSSLVKKLLLMGSNAFQVVLYELAISSLFFGFFWILLRRTNPALTGSQTVRVLLWGMVGVGGTALALYSAVGRIPVALAIVLLFQYVPWVFLLEFLVYKIRPSRHRWAALGLILGGTILATDVLQVQWSGLDPLGIVLAAGSGLCYGTFIFSSRQLAGVGTPLVRSFVICLSVFLLLLVGGLLAPKAIFVPPEPWWPFLGLIITVSILGQIVPLVAFTRAVPLLGGSLAAIIASVELPVACLTAMLLLDETLHLLQWLGIGAITLAIAVGNWRPAAVGSASPPGL